MARIKMGLLHGAGFWKKPIVGPKRDAPPITDDLIILNGIVFERADCLKRSSDMPDDEREAAVHRHAVRVEEELEQIRLELARRPKRTKQKAKVKYLPLPGGLKWDNLLMLNCASCSHTLLSEKHEWIRTVLLMRRGRKPGRLLSALPEPVGGRRHDRPYCESCLARQAQGEK